MNFKDVLNADHEAIIQWSMHGFRWWVDELLGMVPPQWRDRFLKRPSIVAEFTDSGVSYRDEDTGERLPHKPRRAVKALAPGGQVLMREVDLPILPMSDIKRMVALDLDRLTPFRSDQALFDAEIVARDPEKGRQQVLLGVLPLAAAAGLMERARTNDIVPAALGAAAPSGGRSKFDFLPALREAEGGGAQRRRATYLWAAAAVLLALNLIVLNYRDSTATAQLRDTVESQQAPVSVAMRLRDKVTKESARRAELLARQKWNSPLQILNAVTEALPNGAWVQRFEWNGRTVHIRGFRKDTPNLLAQIEASPLLRNAHSVTSDPHAVTAATGSFDVVADKQTESGR